MIINKTKVGDFHNWRFRIVDDVEMDQMKQIIGNMPWKSQVIFHHLDNGVYRVDFMVERHAEWYSQKWEVENDTTKVFSKSGLTTAEIMTAIIDWVKRVQEEKMFEYIFNEKWPDKRIVK